VCASRKVHASVAAVAVTSDTTRSAIKQKESNKLI